MKIFWTLAFLLWILVPCIVSLPDCYRTFERMECEYPRCANSTCSYSKISTSAMKLAFGCTLLDEYEKIQVTAKQYILNKSGVYKPGLFNFALDACLLSTGITSNMLSYLVPNYASVFAKWIHPCPYSGSYYVKNFQMDIKHIPAGQKTGQYRADILFMNGKTEELFVLKFYGKNICTSENSKTSL